MNWMDKLERKWGRHAVANLSRYFVLAQVIGYVVQLTAPGLMSYMNFDMGSILHGQLWRVVTWIFTPTASDRKSTRLNSSHMSESRMPSSA